MKKHYKDWIYSFDGLDVFITITLKQAIPNGSGGLFWLNRDEIQKTSSILRNNITRKVVGRSKTMPFIVFAEGGSDLKRFHLHILTKNPAARTFEDFAALVRSQASRLHWVHREIDIRQIANGTYPAVVSYCFKEGTDAFLPEASSIS